ncbi:Alcohol O-acetyltransferase 1 [Coniochaeta hoffmannii]|uniref:Alcohol O-acetyltransferase 1 n=1 Tax=Coniochaeta hoffmannii TaxID=91930 RepID=A0AA38VQ92_9PEZI|nr:Alcohol O-acetyltransferase 1 [Coniochaeta hoffmannii]
MASGTPRLARPVGLLESYSTSRHNLGFYCCVALTARYSVPLLGCKDVENTIEHAVAQTILAHPVLQAGIEGEDTAKPYFVYLPTLDLSRHIRWERLEVDSPSDRDAAFERLLEARHSSLWPDLRQCPGYEFVILPHPGDPWDNSISTLDVVFAFHHAYGDGNSGVILQQTFLQALDNPVPVPSYNPSTRILTIDTPATIPPPQDALINFKISLSFLTKTLWGEFGPSFLKPAFAQPAWAGKPITTYPKGTRLRLISFPASTASGIVAQCRAKSTTLTPLIHILILHSLAKWLSESELQDRTLASTTPISLRRLLGRGGKQGFDPGTSMGVLLASQEHRFSSSTISQIRSSLDEDLLWDLTSSLGAELRRKVASLPNDDVTALMAWVSDWNARWRGMLGKERQHTWEVSNVGAAEFGGGGREKSGWRVERLVFSQSGSVAGSAFAASVAGVRGGELAVALSWQDTIVEEELVAGVAGDLREWLTCFARTGRLGWKA